MRLPRRGRKPIHSSTYSEALCSPKLQSDHRDADAVGSSKFKAVSNRTRTSRGRSWSDGDQITQEPSRRFWEASRLNASLLKNSYRIELPLLPCPLVQMT